MQTRLQQALGHRSFSVGQQERQALLPDLHWSSRTQSPFLCQDPRVSCYGSSTLLCITCSYQTSPWKQLCGDSMRLGEDVGPQQTWIQILIPPAASCVFLGKGIAL